MNFAEKTSNTIRNNAGLWIFIVLVIGSGLFSHLLTQEYEVEVDGGRKQVGLVAKLLLGFSYGLSVCLIALFWRESREKFTLVGGLWLALLGWSVGSIFWGQFNLNTGMRLFGFLGCTLIGVMLYACSENIRQLLTNLFWVCVAGIVINLIFLDLATLTDFSARNIKGVFFQKNGLGHFSVFALFIAGFVMISRTGFYRWLSVLLLLIAARLLLLSSSMTSNLLIPIALMTGCCSLMIQRYRFGWVFVSIGTLIGVLMIFYYWAEFFDFIGKKTTFTGRTFIWQEYWALIEQRFWLGHGYGAYPQKLTHWLKVGPHNGYIETLYYIGVIGTGLLAVIIVLMFKHWWVIVWAKRLALESSFLISFLIMFLALNTTETYLLNRSGLYWPLFVYASLQLSWLSKLTASTTQDQ